MSSRLSKYGIFDSKAKIKFYRHKDEVLNNYFTKKDNFVFCKNIKDLLTVMRVPQYKPDEWHLLINSSKQTLKCALLHNANVYTNGAQPFCYCRPQYKVSFNLRQPSSQEKFGTFLLSPHHLLPVIFLVKLTRNSPLQVSFLFHPSAGVSNLFEPRAILTHKIYWRAIQRKHPTFCIKIIVISKKKRSSPEISLRFATFCTKIKIVVTEGSKKTLCGSLKIFTPAKLDKNRRKKAFTSNFSSTSAKIDRTEGFKKHSLYAHTTVSCIFSIMFDGRIISHRRLQVVHLWSIPLSLLVIQ